MNLFRPPKTVKKVYLRYGEHPFVLLAVFIFSASKENWNKNDIRKVVQEAKRLDYNHFFNVLKAHSSSYKV